jgi:hypothetical protein
MRNATFLFVCSFFCVIFLSVFTQAQNSLTHNTGTLEVTIIDNGYLGDDGSGTYGGVVFNGNPNAMYAGGFIFGQYGQAWGNMASFLIEDIYNAIPITGFSSNAFFNQITDHTFALILNPDSRTNIKSYSNAGQDFVFIRGSIYNNTTTIDDLYPGIFADWDIGNYVLNRGGYDPSRNLFYVYDNGGGTDPSFYGIMGINVGPNTWRGTVLGSISPPPHPDSVRYYYFNRMTSTVFDTITTDKDCRILACLGPFIIPAGSTLVVDMAIVAGTSLADLQANADEAILYGQYVPVELTSFTANVNNEGNVILNWSTATEINNQMFEIERRSEEGQFIKIGYVEGNGTTTEPQEYTYIDNTVGTGTYFYRLKQIDFLGTYEYSEEIELKVSGPLTFGLEQNYPNPFNPSTNIKYSLPESGIIKLAVYNVVGEEVAVLAEGFSEAGFFDVNFSASNLPSGIYVYKLQSGNFVESKKMLLLK